MASREVRRAGHARGQLSRAERGVDTGGYFSRYVPQHHPAPGPSARCYSRGDRGRRSPVRSQGGIAALPVGHGGCSLRAGGAPRRRGDDGPVGIAPRAPNATQGRPAPTTLTGWFHLGLAHPPRRPSTFSNDEGPGRRKHRLTWAFTLERVRRIELPYSAWEADVLPLNYTRVGAPTVPSGLSAASRGHGRRTAEGAPLEASPSR